MKRRSYPLSRAAMRGVAAVEFGLLITPMVLMAFGATELGRAIYSYNTLDKRVRDAARHLSQHGPGDPVIRNEAKCIAVHGTTNCTGPVAAPGLTTAMVVVCDSTFCPSTHVITVPDAGTVSLVSASIQGYAYNSLVEFVIPDMTFNNITVTMRGLP